MAAVSHVALYLLTPLSRFLWGNRVNFPKHYSTIPPEAGVVGSYTARLHPQHEAGQSVIVDFKRLGLRLSILAAEQCRSNEGLHAVTPKVGSVSWIVPSCAYKHTTVN
jgi:hypothetical protein